MENLKINIDAFAATVQQNPDQSLATVLKHYKDRPYLQGATRRRRGWDQYTADPEGRGQWVAADPDLVNEATFVGFKCAVWHQLNHMLGVSDADFRRIQDKNDPMQSPVVIHPKNKGKIDNMIRLLLSDDRRGICLMGSTGTGKTMLMRALIAVNNKYVSMGCINVRRINTTAYYDISLDIEKHKELNVIDRSIQGSTFIDDFYYRGDAIVRVWGKEQNVAELIIERCHHQQERGHRMYMTSNFDPDDIAQAGTWGPSMSRYKGMMHFIEWSGDVDFRQR
jgi:hypothetical protein